MGLIKRSAEFGKTLSSQSISQDASTATALTVPDLAISALITAWGNAAYRIDGTSPTATVGHVIPANGSVEIFGDDLRNCEVISQAGTVIVFVTYFGE